MIKTCAVLLAAAALLECGKSAPAAGTPAPAAPVTASPAPVMPTPPPAERVESPAPRPAPPPPEPVAPQAPKTAEPATPPPPAPQAQDGRGPLKVGVVNLKTCFEGSGTLRYDRAKEVDEELKGQIAELDKKAKELRNDIDTLIEQIKALVPSQNLHHVKSIQLGMKQAELKLTGDLSVKRIQGFYTDLKREVFNDIQTAVDAVSKEQNYDLIFRIEQPLLEEKDERTLTTEIISRVVMYHHERLDITPLVIKRLNEDWAKKRAALGWECKDCKKKNTGDACTATPGCKGKKP